MYSEDIQKAAKNDLPWDRLRGKNILIAGATGLIGSAIVDILMANEYMDYTVYALGRNKDRAQRLFSNYLKTQYFHFIQHDITEPLPTLIPFHYIIQAASDANPTAYSINPVDVIKANIEGTNNLLSYGLSHDMEKLVFVSSGDVYGEGDGRVFTEDYSGYVNPLNIRSCYTSSKRATESLCIAYSYQFGLDVSIARPSHTYGPHFTESDTRVYAQFIRNILRGEDIVMKSSGEQFRSWCYVVDCALGILYITLKGANREAYNVADENSNISIRELAEMIADIGGVRVIVDLPTETELRGFNPVSKSCFDTSKLRALGWKPDSPMKENIIKTIFEKQNK
jgi:nucleoside-diphosphate-sugar epimerase